MQAKISSCFEGLKPPEKLYYTAIPYFFTSWEIPPRHCPSPPSLCPRRTGDRDLAGVVIERKGTRLPVDRRRSRTPGQSVPVDYTVNAHPSR